MMVVKKHILATIVRLNRLYDSAPPIEATYYSKLAIIELCGWIELSMDNIAEHFGNKKLKTRPFQDSFRTLIEKNYGFAYKRNFRNVLSKTIGLHNMEKIESKINADGGIIVLDSTLEILGNLRNDAAHTHIGTTTTYQSPSVTISQLEIVYPILKKFSKEIKGVK